MSRLFTCGFEAGYGGSSANSLKAEDAALVMDNTSVTSSFDTTVKNSGARSLKFVGQTVNSFGAHLPLTVVLSRTYFVRMAYRIDGFQTGGNTWPVSMSDGTHGIEIMHTPAGVMTLANASNDATIVSGPTLSTSTWYVLEFSYKPSTGACELRVNGVSQGTGTAETSAVTSFLFPFDASQYTTASAMTCYFDDWAINDDQGAANNSWCGNANQVVLLKPVSDSSRTGFTAGAGATTSLFDAVDNTPPVGVVLASATNTSQIKDATSNTTDNYQPNLAAYTTAIGSGGGGLGASDTIVCAQGIVVHGNSTTTSRTNGIQVVSNPTIAETTGTTGTTAAATWPTGWTALKTAISQAPSPTLGTGPVLEFRKATASTDSAMSALMGLLVEYTPSTGLAISVSDSSSVSETVTVVIPGGSTPAVNVSDSTSLTDTPALQVTRQVNVSDSTSTTETVSAKLSDAAVSVSDSVSTTNLPALQCPSPLNVTDSAHATESVTVSAPSSSPQISVSESTTTSEWIVIAFDPDIIFTLEVNVSDAAATSETTSAQCPSPLNVTDSAHATETTGASISSPQVNVSDSAHATETTSATMADLKVAPTDSTSTSESVTVVLPLAGSLTIVVQDSAHATETTNCTVSTSQIAVSDSTSTTESRGVFVNASGNPPNTHPPLGGTFDTTTSGGTFNGGASGGNITTTNRGGNVTFTGPGGTPNTGSSGGTIKKPTRGGIVQLPAAGGDIE